MGRRLDAWKKRHWEPRHGVGFHADGTFLSPGRTVYPPLRRIARWAERLWAEKPVEVLALIVGALGVVAAFLAIFHR